MSSVLQCAGFYHYLLRVLCHGWDNSPVEFRLTAFDNAGPMMNTIRVCLVILGLSIPAVLACGQARNANGRIVTPYPEASVPDFEYSALGPLIGITADQLRNEYTADKQSCTVPFRPYVALRLAEKNYHFDRGAVLREMCARRTASFAVALQSAPGVYGTLAAPGAKQNQELRDAEREYLRQIDAALKARPAGK